MLACRRWLFALVAFWGLVNGSFAAERNTGPWDVNRLATAPQAEWGETKDGVQQVYFAGEPYQGKPTRVFAYYAKPSQGDGPFPAMVLLHGGGGKAFAEWAKLWADRGYVALALDLAGNGPDGKRLADGGPGQDDKSKFGDFTDEGVREKWTYHAVADALLGYSLLVSRKEVDSNRIGVTGISWGGYLTCIVAGVDERFKVAVPVYGCGFIHENSTWVSGYFNKMNAEQRARWVKYFDPSSYLAGVSCPILFVNGTNDFAYPPDSYHKSYSLVDEKLRHLRITVNMPHGHQPGWAPKEIGAFVDSVFKDGKRLAKRMDQPSPQINGQVVAFFELPIPIKGAQLHFTTDEGDWQKRTWQTRDAEITMVNDDCFVSALSPGKEATYFFTIIDERGFIVSSSFEGALK